MEDPDVILTDEQYSRAHRVAQLRYSESKKKGCQQAYGAGGYKLETDVLGATGELAYCIYTDQEWSESVNTFKAPDVGVNIQVRTTDREEGRLIVRSRDKDGDIFVLVVTDKEMRQFKIVGSILGRDAKQKKYLSAPNERSASWFVDRSALAKIENKQKIILEDCSECHGSGKMSIEEVGIQIECTACKGSGKKRRYA